MAVIRPKIEIPSRTPLSSFDAYARKETPLYTGLFRYFPDALVEVARVSYLGSKQHHPDDPVWWDKTKSTDHEDCALRHLLEAGTRDTDGGRHLGKAAWRILAALQLEIEREKDQSNANLR